MHTKDFIPKQSGINAAIFAGTYQHQIESGNFDWGNVTFSVSHRISVIQRVYRLMFLLMILLLQAYFLKIYYSIYPT